MKFVTKYEIDCRVQKREHHESIPDVVPWDLVKTWTHPTNLRLHRSKQGMEGAEPEKSQQGLLLKVPVRLTITKTMQTKKEMKMKKPRKKLRKMKMRTDMRMKIE